MASAQRQAPSVPAAQPISERAAGEFESLKQALGGESWEMAPNGWDAIQIAYVKRGTEQQAKAFASAIDRPQQEIL